ncbi:MAG: (2Fe-2S) ferredoxin domain-containing protein, partial [Bacteroidales bacterium]|nr:(2Fe-2S) ferredoxin domain-containing protein [Bacteroidales bacterium]
MKTKSVDDLMVIRRRAEGMLSLREKCNAIVSEESCGLDKGTEHIQILCCGGTGCKASESALIAENLQASIKEHGIADKVDVITTGCFGFCEKGPIVKIIPDNT